MNSVHEFVFRVNYERTTVQTLNGNLILKQLLDNKLKLTKQWQTTGSFTHCSAYRTLCVISGMTQAFWHMFGYGSMDVVKHHWGTHEVKKNPNLKTKRTIQKEMRSFRLQCRVLRRNDLLIDVTISKVILYLKCRH